MSELQKWQREVGKVSLKEGERAFVMPDGKVIANDTKNADYQVHSKKRFEERIAKRRESVELRLKKQADRIAKKTENKAKIEGQREAKKAKKLAEKLTKKKQEKEDAEKQILILEAQLSA